MQACWRDDSRNNPQDQAEWPAWAEPGLHGADPDGASGPLPSQPRRLALFGLARAQAEPVTMLAEILGWQVLSFPSGETRRPPARLCLAALPAGADEHPPIVAWSPELNLNELISQAGLSIMDQPLCMSRVELMLEALVCEP